MRIVFLRPPRYVWPFNSETSAFWQPLGLLTVAAAAIRRFPRADIQVWDAPAEKCGWKTLRRRLAQTRIDVLGIGEEAVSAHEALRAARWVKHVQPDCRVVAGGMFFPYVLDEVLQPDLVDVVVRGEGENTFTEWLEHAGDPAAWAGIRGLAFRDENDRIVRTPPRDLIEDLDTLPFAAYDRIDWNRYGNRSRNHPGLVSIEHSRGCIDNCSFCILWSHMGRSVSGNGRVAPCWRTKSPERSFDEVARLVRDHRRRTFGWVDPTFNARPEWSDGFAEYMLASRLVGPRGPRTIHTAWLRADGVLRDEKLGVLDKLVRAGLRQVMIGIERDDPAGMGLLGKSNNDLEVCRAALAVFREKYPQVYTIGTMIFGLPADTAGDLKRLVARQYELGVDYTFLIPFTPNPGTALTESVAREGLLVGRDRAAYNFHTPVCRTRTLSRRQLEALYYRLMLRPDPRRLIRSLRIMLANRDRRKRRVHLSLLRHGTRLALRSLAHRFSSIHKETPTLFSRRPRWYDN